MRLSSFLFILVLFSFCTKASAQLQKEEITIDTNTIAVVSKDGYLILTDANYNNDHDKSIVFYDGRIIKLPFDESIAVVSDEIVVTYSYQVDSINSHYTTVKKYLIGKNCGLELAISTKINGWRLFNQVWQDGLESKIIIHYQYAVEGGSCADSLKLMDAESLQPLGNYTITSELNCMSLRNSQVSIDKLDMVFQDLKDKSRFKWMSVDRKSSKVQVYDFVINNLAAFIDGALVRNKLYITAVCSEGAKYQVFGIEKNSGFFLKQNLSNYPWDLWVDLNGSPMVLMEDNVFSVSEKKRVENQPIFPSREQALGSFRKLIFSTPNKITLYGY